MADSYTLREAAEILGLSRRALQRRLEEGAFPGRFTVPGRGGLEPRIPAEEVERELDLVRKRGGRSSEGEDEGIDDLPASIPRATDSLVPYARPEIIEASSTTPVSASSALSASDIEPLRDALLTIIREDREVFVSAVREALLSRDREISALRQDLALMQRTIEGVRTGLESIERRLIRTPPHDDGVDPLVWADILAAGPSPESVDVENVLREIQELEALLDRGSFG